MSPGGLVQLLLVPSYISHHIITKWKAAMRRTDAANLIGLMNERSGMAPASGSAATKQLLCPLLGDAYLGCASNWQATSHLAVADR